MNLLYHRNPTLDEGVIGGIFNCLSFTLQTPKAVLILPPKYIWKRGLFLAPLTKLHLTLTYWSSHLQS